MSQTYTISNGELTLTLDEVEPSCYIVRSPMDPELITQADSIADAFESARDAMEALRASRAKLIEQLNLAAG